ncbi:MAG: DUF3224 domain-containing protein [Solirubrobacteraceae bacterium]
MTARATGTFAIEGWDETTYMDTEEGGKLTKASVKQAFSGDIEGEGSVEWLMCYGADETAHFVGLQRIVGRIGERSGTVALLQTHGTFDGKEAKGELSVVPGSGTGELRGLRGTGAFGALHGAVASMTLDYEIDRP